MINLIKESLWKQFGASIDMLKNAIELWPEEDWTTDKRFFYNAYHVVVFLDYYLTNPPQYFSPRLRFTITEWDKKPKEAIDDLVPDRIYSKMELLGYLESNRKKCFDLIQSLTEETLSKRWIEEDQFGGRSYSTIELLLYNMRHVQHHTAQLNLFLRNRINNAPAWVSRAKEDL